MLRVSGTAGALRVGYQTAATLGAWRLEPLAQVPRAYRCTAVVSTLSDYWLQQTPQDVVLEVGTHTWRWRGVTAHVTDDGQFTVTLTGTPEMRTGVMTPQEAETLWVRSGR